MTLCRSWVVAYRLVPTFFLACGAGAPIFLLVGGVYAVSLAFLKGCLIVMTLSSTVVICGVVIGTGPLLIIGSFSAGQAMTFRGAIFFGTGISSSSSDNST